jgi:O-antigen biosynthesis protein
MSGYWNNVARHTEIESIWMAHPDVRAAINRRVSGDPNAWPLFALKRWLGSRAPIANAVSIGCGVGGLERGLVGEGIVRKLTGVDNSPAAIEEARRQAGPNIEYVVGDAREYLRHHQFDAVFFHQSLHHLDELDDLMGIVRRAIRPDGFLYIDEYVGPSRDEWRPWKLLLPNLAYYAVPRSARRPHIVRAPINREDPTEAIRSSGIIPAIERHFKVVDRRDYGGNLLAVVYPNLRKSADFDRAVRRLIAMEEFLLRLGRPSFYSAIIAR